MISSIKFPRMFNSSATNVVTGISATAQNLLALLSSERREFISDPDFGTAVKRYVFEQNNFILRDIIIDEIFTQISIFMPQLIINRKDITIIQNSSGKRARLEATIKVTNRLDFTTNMFNLVLFDSEEE